MKVQDIMTRDVITVGPETPVHDAARLMVDHGVSGLPVVDEHGRVVGVVSEGDLIVRQKPREEMPWWRSFFADPEALARQYQKAAGTIVAEVMTRPVISAPSSLPIESAALILDRYRIRRVPIVDDGRLVGIVSRGDLVKAIAMVESPPVSERSDEQLVEEMRERLAQEPWIPKHAIVVHANDGKLVLWGRVGTAAEKSALETMARTVPGAKAVESHLAVPLPHHYGL